VSRRQRVVWVIVCSDYTTHPYVSRESAERGMAQIVEAGHCFRKHPITEFVQDA
jgi:hypothetical protein